METKYVVSDKQNELKKLKEETEKMFFKKLEKVEYDSVLLKKTAEEMNQAFWEDIYIEVNYRKLIKQLENNSRENKQEKRLDGFKQKDLEDSKNWYNFFENNKETFRHFRGIELYDIDKDNPKERYNKVKKMIDISIWNKIYPYILFQMHNVKINKTDKEFISDLKNYCSGDYKDYYEMSLLIINNTEREKLLSLGQEIKKEINSLVDRKKMGKLIDSNTIEEQVTQKIFEKALKHGKKRKLANKRIACNFQLFLKILNYKEKDIEYDIGLVLKLCDQLTNWISFYLYIGDDTVIKCKYDGMAIIYYLKLHGFDPGIRCLFFSNDINEKFLEMVEKVELIGELQIEYKQIKLLNDKLKILSDDEWETIQNILCYIIESY